MHTNTVYDHRRTLLPAAPFNEQVPTPPITSDPCKYDGLPHVQAQKNRGPQYFLATFPRDFLIDDLTNVPGLETKRTLLSSFNEVVAYKTYWLKDKCPDPYPSEIHRLKKRIGFLLPTLREFDGKKPMALLTFLLQVRDGLNALGVSEAAAVRKRTHPLRLLPARRPLEAISIEILGPLTKTKKGYRFLLLVTDRFAKVI